MAETWEIQPDGTYTISDTIPIRSCICTDSLNGELAQIQLEQDRLDAWLARVNADIAQLAILEA